MHSLYSPSPTPSGSRIRPAFRGFRKWSMRAGLYCTGAPGPGRPQARTGIALRSLATSGSVESIT